MHQGMQPVGLVDASPETTVRIRASGVRFDPTTLELRAGVPTRIELQNDGVLEHALVVKAPNSTDDWIHLHAKAGDSDTGVYRLTEPGRYPFSCTIPGHTEAGMVGELVVK
jgi:uncharacterized cupredoxin-like copper-binding protein